jgi:hypothetical protein
MEIHFKHIDYLTMNHLMKKTIFLCLICLLLPKLANSEEPDVSWAGNMVIVSVPGDVTHGDKMRFIIKAGRCNQVHHAFTIYTYVKEPKLKPLENKTISLTLNNKPFHARVIWTTPFLMGTLVWFEIGNFPIEEYLSQLDRLNQFEIKVASSKDFVAEDYFDITKNSWDLSKLSKGIEKGRKLCLLGST